MPNKKNKQIVEKLGDKVKRAKSILLADYRGLNAENVGQLRAQIRENKGEVVIAKNTLLKIALKEANIDISQLGDSLKGPTTAILSYEDAVSPIKTVVEFAKKFELPKVKAALIEGIYAGTDKIEEISNIPSKEILISRFIGSIKSPLSGLTNTLGGVQRKFVYAVNAIKNKKEEGGAN